MAKMIYDFFISLMKLTFPVWAVFVFVLRLSFWSLHYNALIFDVATIHFGSLVGASRLPSIYHYLTAGNLGICSRALMERAKSISLPADDHTQLN